MIARRRERPDLPRSARWRDGEHLATGDHEIVRVAWMPDLGKSCVERGLEQGSWIAGTQFEPCAEPGLLVVRRVVGEFDAEMPAAGKTDNKHRLIDARELDGPHRAAQERLKALSQFLAPVRASEDMHVAAKSDHDLPTLPADLGANRSSAPQPSHPPTRPDHDVRFCPSRTRRPSLPSRPAAIYPAGVNFVVCPYDGANLKVVQPQANPALPLLVTCPDCGRQFRLVRGRAIEADADGEGPGI